VDKATLGGLVLAIGGILLGLMLEGGNIGQVLQPTAAMIVFGGTLGAVLIQYPLPVALSAFRRLAQVLVEPVNTAQSTIELLVKYANQARPSRATEIVRLLIVRNGFAPDRLSAAGYAEYHPVATNLTAEGRGMNRRVDIVILSHALPEAPVTEPRSEAGSKPQAALPTVKQSAQPSPAVAPKPRVVSDTGEPLQD
jgi:hypothetical protein